MESGASRNSHYQEQLARRKCHSTLTRVGPCFTNGLHKMFLPKEGPEQEEVRRRVCKMVLYLDAKLIQLHWLSLELITVRILGNILNHCQHHHISSHSLLDKHDS